MYGWVYTRWSCNEEFQYIWKRDQLMVETLERKRKNI
jgi:hypothetical protein